MEKFIKVRDEVKDSEVVQKLFERVKGDEILEDALVAYITHWAFEILTSNGELSVDTLPGRVEGFEAYYNVPSS